MHRAVFERLASPLGVVVRESESVRFSVYSDDDIRRLSVARVHSAEQRDALNRPLPGGLYDPGMGPTDHYSSCPSCGLDYTHCPGHLGRIELTLPVYLPALFPTLVQLLRGKCLHCHAFRTERKQLRLFVDALSLLNAGLIVDAASLLDDDRGLARNPSSRRRRTGTDATEEAQNDDHREAHREAYRDDPDERYPDLSQEALAALHAAASEQTPNAVSVDARIELAPTCGVEAGALTDASATDACFGRCQNRPLRMRARGVRMP